MASSACDSSIAPAAQELDADTVSDTHQPDASASTEPGASDGAARDEQDASKGTGDAGPDASAPPPTAAMPCGEDLAFLGSQITLDVGQTSNPGLGERDLEQLG